MDFNGLVIEQDEDDDFFDPCDRLSTAIPINLALGSDYEDDNEDEFFEASRMSLVSASIKRLVSIKSTVSSNPSLLLPKGNYDMWISEPGDVNERRKRLLQGMGLTSSKEFLRLATSKRVRAISIKIEAPQGPTPTDAPEPKGSDAKVDSSVENKSESQKDGGGAVASAAPPPSYRAIVLVRSRSDGDVELFSSKIKQRKEELIGPASKNKITRTLSGQLAPCVGVSQYACAVKLFPGSEKPRQGKPNEGGPQCIITDNAFGSFFLIKNLDTGNDFIVKDINEQGMWNSLNDVQTGKQLTMEEFEKSAGYSPVVKELMRRASRNVSEGRKIKKGFRNSTKKGAALLKSITGAAGKGSTKVEEREKEKEKEEEREKESSGKVMSQWVDSHQHGKTYKEFTALHMCQEIRGHEGSIWAMSFSGDWRFLASGGEDSVVHVWEVGEREAVAPEEGGGAAEGSRVEVSAMPVEMWRKGRKSGKGNPFPDYVKVPETIVTLSETPVCSFEGHKDQVLDLCWSKSQVLLSSSMDKTVKMWDLETKSCLKTFPHKDYVTCIQFNPVDEKHFISGSLDGKVRIWSIPDNRVADWTDFHEMVTAASYTPDGQGAIIGSQEGSCAMYSTEESRLEHRMDIQKKKKTQAKKFPSPAKKIPGFQSPAPPGKITGLQFAPWNQSEVLITSADSRIGLYNGPDIIQKFKGFRNTSSQISASFSPHGKHIISASEDSQVYIWKVDDSKKKKTTPLIIQAHEHFQSKDVSVAITWPGSSKIEPPLVDLSSKKKSKRPSAPPLPPPAPTVEPFEEGDSGTGLPPLPKKKNTEESASGDEHESTQSGPEHQGSNSEAASDGESQPTDNVGSNSSNTIHATAWGLVIVTASLEGEIRVYQNFGLPLKLARQAYLF